jgi:hypothetical protein
MKLHADARVPFPLDLVYRTYRDELSKLVPYLPNIRSIDVKEREETDGGVRLLNVWRGEAKIPRVAQGFIKPEMLAWDDHATWDDGTYSCSWRTVPHFLKERIDAHGTTTLVADGDNATRMEIRGDFSLDLMGMRGVPRMMVSSATKTAETFIVTLLKPNLVSVSDGLEGYLRSREGS